MDFSTGYRIDLEDRDNIRLTAQPFKLMRGDFTAPEEIDPRGKVRHDKQFDMGSCQGHAQSSLGEFLRAIQTGDDADTDEEQFSRLFAYLESQRFDGLLGADQGSTINAGLRVAREIGFCPESLLKYSTPYPRNARSLVTAEMRAAAAPLKVRSHAWLRSYSDVFNYLASGVGGIEIGHAWNNSHYGRGGVLESVSFGARDGGHAVAWLGYSKRKDASGRNYIWRLNSHNDDWTEIAPRVVDQVLGHRWTACVGMSDLSTPEPRVIDWTQNSLLG